MKGFNKDAAATVDLRDKIAYAIGSLGKEVVFGVFSSCLFLYCIQELSLDATFLGVLYLTNIVIGIVLAPIFGVLLDNTCTRFGKYKPWVVGSTILNLIALAVFFFLPQFGTDIGERIIYISAIYTLWALSFLMLDTPGWAMLSIFNTNNITRDVMSQVPNFNHHLGNQLFILATLPLLDNLPVFFTVNTDTYTTVIISCGFLLLFSQTIFVLMLHPSYNQSCPRRAAAQRAAEAKAKAMASATVTTALASATASAGAAIASTRTIVGAGAAVGATAGTVGAAEAAIAKVTPKATTNQTQPQTAASSAVASLAQAEEQANAAHVQAMERETQEAARRQQEIDFMAATSVVSLDDGTGNNMIRSISKFLAPVRKFIEGNPNHKSTPNLGSVPLPQHQNSNYQYPYNNHNADFSVAATSNQPNESSSRGYESYAALSSSSSYGNAPSSNPWNQSQWAKGNMFSSAPLGQNGLSATMYQNFNAVPAELLYSQQLNREQQNQGLTRAKNSASQAQNTANSLVSTALAIHTSSANQRLLNLRSTLQVLTKNDQLLVVFLSTILLYTIYGLIMGGYFSLFIEKQQLFSPSIYAIIVTGLLTHLGAISSFELLVRRTSRSAVFNISLLLMLLGFILILFVQNSNNNELFLPILVVSYILSSAGIGFSKVAITSMTIDTVDYGEFKLSVRTDGLIFALRNVAHNLGELIVFFYYSSAVFVIFSQVPRTFGLSFNLNLAVILVIILLILCGLIYMHLYKLNGAFYRNVLNNLQFLKQNQHWHSHNPTTNRFMLRYALDESAMIIKLKAKNVDELMRAMVQKLSEVNAITSEHDYMVDLQKRLRQGACGIAEGIALPHAKSSAVRRATVVVATLDTPMDLGALDDRKCDLIFLLASPDDGFTHLNLLGRLSLLLNEPNFADKLRTSGSPTELFERLVQCEKHLVR